MDIPKRIREIRETKKLRQIDVAQKIGIEVSQYNRYEKRGKKLTIEQLEQIANALDVTLKELLFEENSGDLERELEFLRREKELLEREKKLIEMERTSLEKKFQGSKNSYNHFKKEMELIALARKNMQKQGITHYKNTRDKGIPISVLLRNKSMVWDWYEAFLFDKFENLLGDKEITDIEAEQKEND